MTDKYTDTERLEWIVENDAMPTKVRFSGVDFWCVDFSANDGIGWHDYAKEECHNTMREAIDFYLNNEETK